MEQKVTAFGYFHFRENLWCYYDHILYCIRLPTWWHRKAFCITGCSEGKDKSRPMRWPVYFYKSYPQVQVDVNCKDKRKKIQTRAQYMHKNNNELNQENRQYFYCRCLFMISLNFQRLTSGINCNLIHKLSSGASRVLAPGRWLRHSWKSLFNHLPRDKNRRSR